MRSLDQHATSSEKKPDYLQTARAIIAHFLFTRTPSGFIVQPAAKIAVKAAFIVAVLQIAIMALPRILDPINKASAAESRDLASEIGERDQAQIDVKGLSAGSILDRAYETAETSDFAGVNFEKGGISPYEFAVHSRDPNPSQQLEAELKKRTLDEKIRLLGILGLEPRYHDLMLKSAPLSISPPYIEPATLNVSDETLIDLLSRQSCAPAINMAGRLWDLMSVQNMPRALVQTTDRSEGLLLSAIIGSARNCAAHPAAIVSDIKLMEYVVKMESGVYKPPPPSSDSDDAPSPPKLGTADQKSERDAGAETSVISFRVARGAVGALIANPDCERDSFITTNGDRAAVRAYLIGLANFKLLRFPKALRCFEFAARGDAKRLAELARLMKARTIFWDFAYGEGGASYPGLQRGFTSKVGPCAVPDGGDTCELTILTGDDLGVMFEKQSAKTVAQRLREVRSSMSAPALAKDVDEYIQVVDDEL